MSKRWQPYAQHILDGIAKIRRIEGRGDLIQDEILYDATLRNLQRLSETTQQLPAALKLGRRDKLVDIAQFLAAKARQPEVRRGAEAIAGRMRNQRLQRQPTIGVNAMRYTVLLHRSDEGISVSVPGLPGCWSEGETEAEALENIRDAIAEYLSAVQDVTGGHEPHEPVTWTSAARPPIC